MLGRFFRCLSRIEDRLLPMDVSYTMDNCRFTRTLSYPAKKDGADNESIDAEAISKAITDYVSLIDHMLKACIGGADAATLADMYAADLAERTVLL